MDESRGTIVDISGNGLVGTLLSSVVTYAQPSVPASPPSGDDYVSPKLVISSGLEGHLFIRALATPAP